jgi:transposase
MARRGKKDPKLEALRAARTLNPRPDAVHDEQFGSSGFFDARDLVQVKYEMVRRVQVDGAPVSHAAAAFGFSRPSYYEAAAALARDGLPGLVPAKPGPRRGHKLTDDVLDHAETLLAADASRRAADLVEPLAARFGVRVHPRSVERALQRRRQARQGPKSG